MHGLPLRKQAPFYRISGRRAVVVVLLLAAGFLLAMPSAADAHVVKAHRAQYAAMLRTGPRPTASWSSTSTTVAAA
jgi:hypothetical protein